jgi:RNA polymerase sigma-70 factor (ECF subfamily)
VELRGSAEVAEFFRGGAQAARPALVDGIVDIAVVPGGRLLVVLRFEIADDRIVGIQAVAEPAAMAAFDLEVLGS